MELLALKFLFSLNFDSDFLGEILFSMISSTIFSSFEIFLEFPAESVSSEISKVFNLFSIWFIEDFDWEKEESSVFGF